MSVVTIVLANPHPIVRNNLRALLERESDFQVVAEAANGREAMLLAEYKRPSAIVLDAGLHMPPVSSPAIEVARTIHRVHPQMVIVFNGTHTDAEYVSAAFDSGAHAYVASDFADLDLPAALRVVARKGRYISPSVTADIICQQASSVPLTAEQVAVYSLLAAGGEQEQLGMHLRGAAAGNLDETAMANLPRVILQSIKENEFLFGTVTQQHANRNCL